MGGAPSTRGKSQDVPAPAFWAASEVGPAREGIQNQPSFSRPSSATLDSARYSPIQTGRVTRVGRHPASGLTPASLYRRATSTCASSGGRPWYRAWMAFTCGCKACNAIVLAICFFVSGYVASLTMMVRAMMAKP